jgi:pimeloyl-ACP methyl ester carboxylesterase
MKLRMLLLLLPILCISGGNAWPTPAKGRVVQRVVHSPGFVEPHTPGSGAPQEVAAAPGIEALLGAPVDLNRVTTVRTRWRGPRWGVPRPRAILILIPGFLGGATTFDPIARDLVEAFRGRLEVWAVDRRPNQLEDRLGSLHASRGAQEPECQSHPPAPGCALFEGAQFYFADLDARPFGNFPGPHDLDIDLDGVLDPRLPLTDRFGVTRGPILFTQDELRFMAYWGLDTYFRDWKGLIERARRQVTPGGVVLLGGHSQGTTWATLFAAYDFDPDPKRVEAGHSLIDGLVLLEGGGAGAGSAVKPTLSQYQATVAALETNGGPDVFLTSLAGFIELLPLGQVGEVASLGAYYQPDEPALSQRTTIFGSGIVSFLLGAPATNRTAVGLFLDDDFSSFGAFRASMGFSDDGENFYSTLLGDPFYQAFPNGALRTWKEFDDPTLPSCPPNQEDVSPGCALLDNGPPSGPGEAPRVNGMEREVTSIDTFARTQFGKLNGFEWYFSAGRPNLDFLYGRDASVLVAESLALDPSDEGPLVITQNASVDVPVIAIGGSNGLAPEAKSFSGYLDSIATPAEWKETHIVEGYAHLDVVSAEHNEAVPLIVDFIRRVERARPGGKHGGRR